MELRSITRRPHRYRDDDDDKIDEYLPPKPVFVLPIIPYESTLPPAAFPTIPLDAYPQNDTKDSDSCNKCEEEPLKLVHRPANEMEKGLGFRWEAVGEPGNFNRLFADDDEDAPRAPFLKGYPANGGEPVEEEYDGWVPRDIKNAEGQMETREFVRAYEESDVQWVSISNGMKLIVVHELTKIMSLQRVSDFLDLSGEENEDFAELYYQELALSKKTDIILERIRHRQLALLMSSPQNTTEEWEAIWEEEYGRVSLGQSSTFSISKADIHLTKRFLYHLPVQENFDVRYEGRERLPTELQLMAVVLRIEGYEGTSTTFFDLDFDDLDEEDGVDDGTEPEGGNKNYVVHNEAEDVVIVEPPASSFNQHPAVFPTFSRPPVAQKTQRSHKGSLTRPVLSETEDAEVDTAPPKGTFPEDSDYDTGESSDTEDEDIPAAVSSHTAASSRDIRRDKRRRGRPKGSFGTRNKKQLSPRKKFASLAEFDENTDLKTPPYNLLPRQKKTHGPTKVVMFKVNPSKLKQVTNASSPASSPGMPPGVFATLPMPSTARSSHTSNKPLKDTSVIPGRLSEYVQGKPAEPPQKPRTGSDTPQIRTKPSPQVANSQLARPKSQAHVQGFESLSAPDLPSMGIPRTQYTSPPLTQTHSTQRTPSVPRSATHPSSYVINNTQPRQQGTVSAPPVADSSTIKSNMRPESSHHPHPQSRQPSLTAGPFSSVNLEFENWSNARNSRKRTTPDIDLVEKQKAKLQEPHHQNSRHYTGSPTSTASATVAPPNRPSVHFDPTTTISPIGSKDREQDAASHQYLHRGVIPGQTTPIPVTAAWNHIPRSRIQSTPESAATRPSLNPRQKSEPVPSIEQPVSVSLVPSTVFNHPVNSQVVDKPGRHTYYPGMNSNSPHQQQILNSTQTPHDLYLSTSTGTNQFHSLAQPHLYGLSQARLQAEATIQNSDAYMRSLPGAHNSASTPPSAPVNTNHDVSQLPANALIAALGVFFEGANSEHQQHQQQMPSELFRSTFASPHMQNNLHQRHFNTTQLETTTSVPPQNYTFTSATPANSRSTINISQDIGQGFDTSPFARRQTSRATNPLNTAIQNTTEVVDLERAVSPTNGSSNDNGRQIFAPTIKYEKTSPSKAPLGELEHDTIPISTPTGALPMFQRSFPASSSGPNVVGASDFGTNYPNTAQNYAITPQEPKMQAAITGIIGVSSTMPRSSSATISTLEPQVSTYAQEKPNAETIITSDKHFLVTDDSTSNTPQPTPNSGSFSRPQPTVSTTPVNGSSFSQKFVTEEARYSPARAHAPNTSPTNLSHAHPTNRAMLSGLTQPPVQTRVPERISSETAPVDTETAPSSAQEPPKPTSAAKPRLKAALPGNAPSDTATASSSTQQHQIVAVKPYFEKAGHDTRAANPPVVPKATRASSVAKDSKVNKSETAPQTFKASTSSAPPGDSKPVNPRLAPKMIKKPPPARKAATKPAVSQPSVEIPAKAAKAAPAPPPKPAKERASTRNYSNIPGAAAPKRAPTKRAGPVPNKPNRKSSKSAAAQAAGYALLEEVEDLEAQKQLNAPPPVLQERSRSEARAMKEAHEKGMQEEKEKNVGNSGFSIVVKSGRAAKRKLEDVDEEVEEKVKRVVKKVKTGKETGASVATGTKKWGGKRAREEEEDTEVVERMSNGRFVKKAKKQ